MELAAAAFSSFLAGWFLRALLPSRRDQLRPTAQQAGGEEGFSDRGDVKLVIAVRQDLKMGKGKAAAQCGHAAIRAYAVTGATNPQLLEQWLGSGQPKVVVKADDEQALRELQAQARALGLGCHTVRDAGRTQVAAGSLTVAAIGPGPAYLVDQVTGSLKLY
eukprot:comp24154_c0_seq1/m.43987 comp24154_c0_seq1/g.43987  ORF comp24154_c0_seq1/g.43987 comp24154_c0_seq1/m.43987 type:complete len:162 (-) comp24154_c0_seq1:591-1076(-)